jgi:hypothetical protein
MTRSCSTSRRATRGAFRARSPMRSSRTAGGYRSSTRTTATRRMSGSSMTTATAPPTRRCSRAAVSRRHRPGTDLEARPLPHRAIRLRPEKISLSVGWEHLVCTRGDRVRVTHDVLLIGLASGRVKSIAGQVVTFDEVVTIEAARPTGMQFRVPADARTIDRAVDVTTGGRLHGADAGRRSDRRWPSATCSLRGDGSGIGQLPRSGHLASEGPDRDPDAGRRRAGDLEADTGRSRNTIRTSRSRRTRSRCRRAICAISGGDRRSRRLGARAGHLTWQVPRFGKIASFQVQQQDDDVGGPWTNVASVPAAHTSTDIPLIAPGVWSFRVRCIFSDGTASDWNSLLGLNLQGLTFAPGDITNLHQHAVDGQTVLDWTIVDDPGRSITRIARARAGIPALSSATSSPSRPGRPRVTAPITSEPMCSRRSGSGSTASRQPRSRSRTRSSRATSSLEGRAGRGLDRAARRRRHRRQFHPDSASETITLPWAAEIVAAAGSDRAAYRGLRVTADRRYRSRRGVPVLDRVRGLRHRQGDDFLGKRRARDADVLGTSPTRFIGRFRSGGLPAMGMATCSRRAMCSDPADIFGGKHRPGWIG